MNNDPWYMYYIRRNPLIHKYYDQKQNMYRDYISQTYEEEIIVPITQEILAEEFTNWIKKQMK